jgi:hypothetical protein
MPTTETAIPSTGQTSTLLQETGKRSPTQISIILEEEETSSGFLKETTSREAKVTSLT